MTEQSHFPYQEEAKLITDIIHFFTDRLPHAVGETAEHLDEAVLSTELFRELSTRTAEELAGLEISRDELPKVAAAASGLIVVANDRKKN